jgi:hypothetical protein
MSQTAYAVRRGCSHVAVQNAIKTGRLKHSIALDARGVAKIADPELADREWAENTDLSEASAALVEESATRSTTEAEPEDEEDDDGKPTLSEAKRDEAIWKAREAERKFRLAAGELVLASEVASKIAGVFSECRTKLLAIPSRVKQKFPHLTIADLEGIETEIREALTELADGDA